MHYNKETGYINLPEVHGYFVALDLPSNITKEPKMSKRYKGYDYHNSKAENTEAAMKAITKKQGTLTSKLLGNIAILIIFWWCLYIVADHADKAGANFVAIMCGMLALGWVVYNLIWKVNGHQEKEDAIEEIISSRVFKQFKASRLLENSKPEDANFKE
jgi:hypothetical protein